MKDAEAYTVVVPTLGRPSLRALLRSLDANHGPPPVRVIVVDDRPGAGAPLDLPSRTAGAPTVSLRSAGQGPATARNVGWRMADTEWVAFLDDDVVLPDDWCGRLTADLAGQAADVGGSQGRVRVPRPAGRRPTDWERNVIGLETACWATADLAYRSAALRSVGGLDGRFRRAFREDADLGLRVTEAGWTIVRGEREVLHPVGPASRWASVRAQRGNRDDQLMAALHGPGWRWRAAAGPARNGRHVATAFAAAVSVVAAATAHRRVALAGLGAWLAGTAELAAARIAPGPRTPDEVITMLATSAAIPPVATWYLLAGRLAGRRALRCPHPATTGAVPAHRAGRDPTAEEAGVLPAAVLFDRDGTLVEDEPYNGDPHRVRLRPGAAEAVQACRRAGLKVGVVTNQSGVARGVLTPGQVAAVNRRVEALVGPVDTWQVCMHGPRDGCGCRKPAPGLVVEAARALGVAPASCVVVGDIGADVAAAEAAGARGILVPTSATRIEEILEAAQVAAGLPEAVSRVLAPRRVGGVEAGPR